MRGPIDAICWFFRSISSNLHRVSFFWLFMKHLLRCYIYCLSSRLTARNGQRDFRKEMEKGRYLNIVATIGCSITVKVYTLHKCVHNTFFLLGPLFRYFYSWCRCCSAVVVELFFVCLTCCTSQSFEIPTTQREYA